MSPVAFLVSVLFAVAVVDVGSSVGGAPAVVPAIVVGGLGAELFDIDDSKGLE